MKKQNLMQKIANPKFFMALTDKLLPVITFLAIGIVAIGMYLAFFVAPVDYQQGHTVKIMFLHVPSAWLGMMGYALMAISSLSYLVFHHPLADVSARSCAIVGAVFTLLALITGALWGKPMWGTYWVWDARLTSVLILFFLYLGIIALRSSIDDEALASKQAAIMAIIGVAILPFIKISVEGLNIPWLGLNLPSWNTLHQPPSVLRSGGPTIHSSILVPLLINALGFTLMFFALHLKAMRNEILRRKIKSLKLAEIARIRSYESTIANF
ncbi:MAG: Heme exporter protein C [Hyphomicrobiaceae bacterium hypho_1]